MLKILEKSHKLEDSQRELVKMFAAHAGQGKGMLAGNIAELKEMECVGVECFPFRVFACLSVFA